MPGLKTDVDPSDNKGPAILGVMWALTMITLALVTMRMYIRIHIVKAFGLDDWLIALSMVYKPQADRSTLNISEWAD